MKNKRVIVTGANSGMGLETTIELARQGAMVIMACRSKERGEKALEEAKKRSNSANIELMILDLGSIRSIQAFAQAFMNRYETLDVLVNNAGVVSLKRQLTEDGFEVMLGVNHLGHFLLTRLLLDTLLRADQGRIVNVSSGAYKIGSIHYEDPTLSKRYFVAKGYARSKLANILFTKELARRTKGTSVTVNCLHPGAVATNIGVDRGTGFGKTIVGMLRPFFLTAKQGAETAIYLATSPEVKDSTGGYFYKKKPKELTARATDPEAARKFWEWSEQQVGLNTER